MKYYLFFLLLFSCNSIISCKSTEKSKLPNYSKMDAASIKLLKQSEKNNPNEIIDFVAQYHNPISAEQIQTLEEMGVEVITYINTFIAARATIEVIKKISDLDEIKSMEIGKSKTK